MNEAGGFDEGFFAASALIWRQGLRDRQFSARELLQAVWERILLRNPIVNALADYDFDAALEAAALSDDRLGRGEGRPLEGLPLTIKDSFETAGLLTTCGAPELEAYRPEADATAVARLRAAGAIILAKSNVPRMAGDFQTYNPVYGVTSHPLDATRSPGGSSGGAAAAVAAGFCAFDLGSDLGSSIRWPAHACGVFGLKPSWGRIPLVGHIPPLPTLRLKTPPDLAVAGPIARSAGDLDLALSVAAGPFNGQGPAVLRKPRQKAPRDLRLALWLDPDFAPVDASIAAAVVRAAQAFHGAGARVEETLPGFDFVEVFEIYAFLNFAIGFSGVSREVRAEFSEKARTFDPADRSYPALQARAARLDAGAYSRLMERRAVITRAFAVFFEDFDAILCPPAPCVAIEHDFSPDLFARRLAIEGGFLPYYDLLKWASPASLAHLPAVVAPAGLGWRGMPCGVQIVCAFDEDRTAIAIASLLETMLGGFRASA